MKHKDTLAAVGKSTLSVMKSIVDALAWPFKTLFRVFPELGMGLKKAIASMISYIPIVGEKLSKTIMGEGSRRAGGACRQEVFVALKLGEERKER